MTRRNEDFDEYCDPNNPRILKYEEFLKAAQNIREYIPPTPCIPSHYQRELAMNLYHKLENLQKTGSFKERGALNALITLPRDKKKIGIVMASLGNQAMGVCFYAQKMNIPITVVMSNMVPIKKLQMVNNLGAKVVVHGDTYEEAQKYAKHLARDKGAYFLNARDHPDIIAGYGSIALEILEQVPGVDAILVPVGSGGLAAAVVTVIKHVKPECLVYGVQPEVIPTFFKSLEEGEPVSLPWRNSLGDSIAVANVGVNSFRMVQPLLDKMILVEEDWISRAILHMVEKERFIIEGAGACSLAAILANLVPEIKLKNVVCIASGGNIDAILLGRCLDRGRAAEGRLVKFKVGIKDSSAQYEKLLRLLEKGQYNVYRIFQDRIWVEDDIYRIEVKVVCETMGLEHSWELKRIIEKAYPKTAIFEAEPFNDTKTCPCYIKKNEHYF